MISRPPRPTVRLQLAKNKNQKNTVKIREIKPLAAFTRFYETHDETATAIKPRYNSAKQNAPTKWR
jgi:hypothetical protein